MPRKSSSHRSLLPRSYRYAWVDDLARSFFLANSRERVRIMGNFMGTRELTLEEQESVPLFTTKLGYASTNDYLAATFEDGTGSIDVWVERHMLGSFEIGQTLNIHLKLRQNGTLKRWVTESLRQVTSTKEEHEWWVLKSHQTEHFDGDSNVSSRYSHTFGFPSVKRDSAEIMRLIQVNVRVQEKRQARKHKKTKFLRKQQQQRLLKLQQQQQSTTPKFKGLSLEDLSTVLHLSEGETKAMIEGLQLDGKIYQNRQGEYLPL